MFIWDYASNKIIELLIESIHKTLLSFLNEFFELITNMGASLFDYQWVKALILFFSYVGWAMFTVGFILAVFETAIAYQNGQSNINSFFLNVLKGFIATSLFTTVPVELFKFAISMQTSLSGSIITMSTGAESISELSIQSLNLIGNLTTSLIFAIFLLVAMGYSVIKVFFSNLKRGGILLTQIAVGSFYMISIPRGFTDGFTGWSKQIIALSLTTFLQSVFLILGLLVFRDNLLLGVGIMLSANEVPRIAEQFGLETAVKPNITSSMYALQTAMNITK